MAVLFAYQKVSDDFTTYTLIAPVEGSATELCTLDDGRTVTSVDGDLPEQHEQLSIAALDVTPAIKAEIRAKSPHIKLIDRRVDERIRAKYSVDDELYFARISIGALAGLYEYEDGEADAVNAFGLHAEQARQWGREQRAALGL